MGNNENYEEQHRLRPGAITQDREILRYLRMGESAFMEEEKRKAWAFIEANPRIEMRLIWLRFIEFWAGTPTPFATFRETDSFSLRLLLPCNYLVPFGALLGGVVLAVKKNALTLALIAFPLVFRCSTALHIIRCAIATRSTRWCCSYERLAWTEFCDGFGETRAVQKTRLLHKVPNRGVNIRLAARGGLQRQTTLTTSRE